VGIREIIKSRYLIISILITPLLFYAAVFAAGGGHGTYLPARIFFPYTMLSTHFSNDTITNPSIIFALIQIPFYGVLLSVAEQKSEKMLLFFKIGIVSVHTFAFILCFVIPIPYF